MFKNKFLNYIILLPPLFIMLFLLLLIKGNVDNFALSLKHTKSNITLNGAQENKSYVGEKITYEIKLGKLHLGKAEFINLENEQVGNKLLNVMTMETKLARFTDMEKIYSDMETLLPVRVERDIQKWLGKEKITEDYDQEKFTVTIVKNKGKNQEELVIKKNEPIHNALLLPYYVRRLPGLELGKAIIANLPTRRLEMKLASIEELEVPAGIFKAYHFTTVPKQIEIWISVDERRIPLRIQGTGLLSYSMVMDEYSFDPKLNVIKPPQ